jgi:hypothetical protein
MKLEFEDIINKDLKFKIEDIRNKVNNSFEKESKKRSCFFMILLWIGTIDVILLPCTVIISIINILSSESLNINFLILSFFYLISIIVIYKFFKKVLNREKKSFSKQNVLPKEIYHYFGGCNVKEKEISKLDKLPEKEKEILSTIIKNKTYKSSLNKIKQSLFVEKLNSIDSDEYKQNKNVINEYIENIKNERNRQDLKEIITNKLSKHQKVNQPVILMNK